MKRVVIELPLAGATPDEVAANIAFAKEAMRDSLARGEAPFLSHLLYPIVLADTVPAERMLGIAAGLAWGRAAELVAVYAGRGVSPGMALGIEHAREAGIPIEFRSLQSPLD